MWGSSPFRVLFNMNPSIKLWFFESKQLSHGVVIFFSIINYKEVSRNYKDCQKVWIYDIIFLLHFEENIVQTPFHT